MRCVAEMPALVPREADGVERNVGSGSAGGMVEKGEMHSRGQSCYEEFKGEKIHGSREQEGRAGGLWPGESPPTLGRAADRQATRTEGGITGIVTPPLTP